MSADSSCEIIYGSSDDDSFHSLDEVPDKKQETKTESITDVPTTPDILLPATPSPMALAPTPAAGPSRRPKSDSDDSPLFSDSSLRVSEKSKLGRKQNTSPEGKPKQLNSSTTPLSSLPPRQKARDHGEYRDTNKDIDDEFNQPIFLKGQATSTPLMSNNRKMMNLDLTAIGEDVSAGRSHLNVTADTEIITSDESGNSKHESASPNSDCELLDDDDLPDINEHRGDAAGGFGINPVQNHKLSPDIDAITEKLRKQHLGDNKPLVKFLEQPPPIPFQARYEPQEMDDWKGSVVEAINKIAKAIESMPDVTNTDILSRFTAPKKLKVELYPHQIYGAKWMWWREHQFPGGGILADEMGLGKTVICIALIVMGKENDSGEDAENWVTAENKKLVPTTATLVICPVGCMSQWENELKTKAKGLKVALYHGSNRTKSAALLSQNDVVITSYATVGSDVPKLIDDPYNRCKSPLMRLHWERVILDEGHIIRNPKTLGAQATCRLTARHRWVVTGTPVHNKAEDFFSLIKFLQLTPFDDPKVWSHWIGMKYVPDSNKERLHIIGKSMILRRTKDEVQKAGGNMSSIPPKTVEDVELVMQESERAIYDHLETFAKQQFKNFLEAQADRKMTLQGAAYTYQAGKAKRDKEGAMVDPATIKFSHMFALLTRLRQSSVLPFLIRTMLDDEEEDDEASYDAFNDPINAKNPVFEPGYKSSKLRAVMDDLKQLKKDGESRGEPMDKVIIVSQWTTLLDILSQHLRKKGFTYASITGAASADERTSTMSKFNSNPNKPQVLLLSIGAGGVGLNLVGANHVFFLEPHWNPMMELQAQDRVHRFGQTKPVFIKRYIVKDTIESRVLVLQARKIELADGLMDKSKKGTGAGLNVADMRTLFGV